MTMRIAATALFTLGALALPAAAQAVPAPDPPRPSVQTQPAGLILRALQQDYARAATAQKRTIHDEILLLVNVGSAAL